MNFFLNINEALQNMCFQVQPIQMMPPTQLILFDFTFWFVFVGFCYIPISFFHVIFGWGAPSAVHGNSNRCPKVTSWLEGLSFHDGGTGIISLKAIIHVCCHSFWWCKVLDMLKSMAAVGFAADLHDFCHDIDGGYFSTQY